MCCETESEHTCIPMMSCAGTLSRSEFRRAALCVSSQRPQAQCCEEQPAQAQCQEEERAQAQCNESERPQALCVSGQCPQAFGSCKRGLEARAPEHGEEGSDTWRADAVTSGDSWRPRWRWIGTPTGVFSSNAKGSSNGRPREAKGLCLCGPREAKALCQG